MADYTKTTNFTAKDALASGNPNKVIKGSEHDTEFDNISTAIVTKSNKVTGGTSGNTVTLSATGDIQDGGYSFSNMVGACTATTSELNTMDGITATTTELNQLAGTTNAVFPSGTIMLFRQTTPPAGWTKDVTQNNKALRVVSGTVGTGGTKAFTTTFGSGKTTDSHTLTESQIPSHTHGLHRDADNFGYGTGSQDVPTTVNQAVSAGTTSATGGDGGHTHNLSNFDLQYVDVIIASKD